MRPLSPKIISHHSNGLPCQIIKRIDELLFLKLKKDHFSKYSSIFLITYTLLISYHSLAQEHSIKLKWLDTKTSQRLYISDLAFEKISHYNENHLPVWAEKYAINNVQISNVLISNEIYEPVLNLKNIDIKHLTSNVTSNFQISYEKKKPYLLVNLIPLRLNPITGAVEKLKSFSITPV